MTSHSVAYATARADLFRLADLGLLERRRVGGRNLFWAPPTLMNASVQHHHDHDPNGGLKA